jgi:hypothetical protein
MYHGVTQESTFFLVGVFWLLLSYLALLLDLLYQTLKNEAVKGQEAVPVDLSPQAHGMVMGGHRQPIFFTEVFDFELKPRRAGNFHFRSQQEPFVSSEILDPPEIDYISHRQCAVKLSRPGGSNAEQQSIHGSPQPPHPVAVKPPFFPPDFAGGGKKARGILAGAQ